MISDKILRESISRGGWMKFACELPGNKARGRGNPVIG